MYRLPQIIFLLGLSFYLQAQSPHVSFFKMDCGAPVMQLIWGIPADAWNFEETEKPDFSKATDWVIGADSLRFNHYNTNFPLRGHQVSVDCRSCNETLVFSEARTECISCHDKVAGYEYTSPACFVCHPNGDS